MEIIMIILILLAIISIARLLIGPTLWDRLMSLNLLTSKLIMILIILSLIRGDDYYLDIGIIYALFGFFGTAFLAIFIQRRGRY